MSAPNPASKQAAAAADGSVKFSSMPSPEANAGLMSRVFFSWLTPLFRLANEQKDLHEHDIYPLPSSDKAGVLADTFGVLFQSARDAASPSPTKTALIAQFKRPMMISGVYKLVNSTLQFLPSFLLAALLNSLEPGADHTMAFVWAALLWLALSAKTVAENQYFHRTIRVSWNVRSTVTAAVYRKALKLSPTARGDVPGGKIVALMSADTSRLEMMCTQAHVLWDSVYQILGYLILLIYFLNWGTALAGFLVILLLTPVNAFLMMLAGKYRRQVVKHNDERTKLVNEALQDIRVVKLYDWISAFTGFIAGARAEEMAALRRGISIRTLSAAVMQTAPAVVSVVTLLVFSATGGEFTASRVFAALQVLGALRFPLMFVAMAWHALVEAKVAVKRLDAFLQMPEVESFLERPAGDEQEAAVEIKGGKFAWESPEAREARLAQAAVLVADKAKLEQDAKPTPLPATPAQADEEQGTEDATVAVLAHGASAGADDDAALAGKPAEEAEPAEQQDGEAEHQDGSAIVLEDISIRIPKGQLWAVIGGVGVGKSALCAALLGEMHKEQGSVGIAGSISFAPQQPFVRSASLKGNIVFAGQAAAAGVVRAQHVTPEQAAELANAPIDEAKYEQVLRACQLGPDIAALDNGDLTEIGERGINLSGGQKARVSVARAAYAGADVVLLDDPLSALDAEVGAALFAQCIKGAMASSTRLLVTNQLNLLPQCDGVIMLDKASPGSPATVAVQGTYDECMRHAAFSELMHEFGEQQAQEQSAEAAGSQTADQVSDLGDVVLEQALERRESIGRNRAGTTASRAGSVKSKQGGEQAAPAAPGKGNLVTTEEKAVGAVPLSVYVDWFRASGPWWVLTLAVILVLFAAGHAGMLMSTFWVAEWTDSPKSEYGHYMVVYVIINLSVAVVSYVRIQLLNMAALRSSKRLHARLLHSVLNAPMAFFDTTPVGRILSRFTKDFDLLDTQLANTLGMLILMLFLTIGTLASVTFATPWFAVSLPLLGWLYVRTLRYFRNLSREAKRLESISRSPVYAHFGETLGGLNSIRAYGLESAFAAEAERRVDTNVSLWYVVKSSDRWLSIRLESLANLVVLLCGMLVAASAYSGSSRDNLAGLAGFAMSYALGVTGVLTWSVRMYAEVENQFNSTERVLHYCNNIAQENLDEHATLPDTWPAEGAIEFKDYTMQYRTGTPDVLKRISFLVEPGAKVGIVGRSGSGKSSTLVALFRLVEDHCHSGTISIDGVDIDQVGLSQLRSRLSIIPQDPVLFSGTLRTNLDPVDALKDAPDADARMWAALDLAGLKEYIMTLPGGLDEPVAEFGSNFSVGQRQLICLARVLLRKSKILLLDEATSSVDSRTDAAMQAAIKTAFPDCTVLTIAHRLSTIAHMDKILVVDAGQVVEYAPPVELLNDPNSAFSALVDELGEAAAAKLRELAAASAKQ